MGTQIRLVGGPADGRTFAIADGEPPWVYRIPMPPPVTEFLANLVELTPKPMPIADYDLLYENGWPRRADDGAYLYRYRVPPVSPEERRTLEQARREAAAAEAKRDAERDAAWREILQERPHYPKDWRDLF